MQTVTVNSSDLKAALSLLQVYMGRKAPGGHFKDPDHKLVDAFYWV
jgi:hypothetical protein